MSSSSFEKYLKYTENVEGWFSDLAVAVSDTMLAFQSRNKVTGHLFEIGAWHGRSAILWLINAKANEHVYVVDFEERGTIRENLIRVSEQEESKFSLTIANSFSFPDAAFLNEHRRKMRLIHIDGDHTAAGIMNDLKIGKTLMHPYGVMIVDDFMNDRFPQITEVCMDYLNVHRHDLALAATGKNKAFIVSAKFFDLWHDFLRESLESELLKRGQEAQIFNGTFSNRPCIGIRS